MKLRLAQMTDVPTLVAIGEVFWEKSPYKSHIDYNPNSVKNLLSNLISNDRVYVAEYEEGIVGAAGIVVNPMPFNPTVKVATELFWYVRPGIRGVGIGEALLGAMEQGAKRAGADVFAMGSMETSDPEQAARMLDKNEYKLTEKTYTKVL